MVLCRFAAGLRQMNQASTELLYVLMADDDADDRMFFAEALGELNLQVDFRTVKDGLELMDYLMGSGIILPQIIFLDLNMPLKNGFQCLSEIRSLKAFRDIFIVIYSTTARPADVELAFKKGASLFINKPSSYDELKKILLKIFTTGMLQLFPLREKFLFGR